MNESERSAEMAADAMLAFLKQREGDLISSKELRFALGPLKFREAVVVLRKRGIAVEATLGASGNWGFRLPSSGETSSPAAAPPSTVPSMLNAWEGYARVRPTSVVLPLSLRGSRAVADYRAAGLEVFYGLVESPVFAVKQEPESAGEARPRPDALY